MNLAIRCLSSNPGPEPADTVAQDQFSDDQFDGDYPLTTSRSQNYLK